MLHVSSGEGETSDLAADGWIPISALSLTDYATLGKLLALPEPQFLHL